MRLFTLAFFLTIALDQLSKAFASAAGWETFLNSGISLALLGDQAQIIIILLTVGVLAVLSLSYGSYWARNPFIAALFFGGSVSNLIDRLWLGGVRDWIHLPVINISNNFADLAIFASIMIMLWQSRKGRNEYEEI